MGTIWHTHYPNSESDDRSKLFNYYSGSYDPKHRVETGDVLLSWSGTPDTSFGCFIWDRAPGVLNQHIFKVQLDPAFCESEYFVFAVNSVLDEMIGQSHGGVGLRHITKGRLEEIELWLAPLDERRRIVRTIRAGLEKIQEIALLQNAITEEAGHLLGSHFNEAEQTNNWPKQKVGDIILDSRNGRSIRSNGAEGNGEILTLSAVRRARLDFSAKKTVDFDDRTATTYRIERGDVFVSRSNTMDLVGLSATADHSPESRVIYPDLLIRLKPNPAKVRPEFLAVALRFPSCREQIKSFAKGTSQSMVKISGAELKRIEVSCPTLVEQDEFIAQLAEIDASIEDAFAQSDDHVRRAMKRSILRQAFSGEL